MSLAALLAAAAVPIGPAAEPTSFELRDSFGGEVDGGGFVFARHLSRELVQRRDFATGLTTTLWRAPREQAWIPAIDAAGGRVAFELSSSIRRSRVMMIDVASGAVSELARGRYYDRRNCGSSVHLEDVAPSGEVLVTKANVPCGRRSGQLVVRAHGPAGTRTLLVSPTRIPFLSDGPPHRRLAGDQLLTFGDRTARVRDLASDAVRQLRPLDPRSRFGPLAVAPDGRVLLNELRFSRRDLPLQTIRLLGPTEQGGASTVVHRSRRAFGEVHFCGDRPMMHAVGPGRQRRLRVLDPPQELFSGVVPDFDWTTSCDAHHFAVSVGLRGKPDRVYVHTLPE
jgi:hypothetical protein